MILACRVFYGHMHPDTVAEMGHVEVRVSYFMQEIIAALHELPKRVEGHAGHPVHVPIERQAGCRSIRTPFCRPVCNQGRFGGFARQVHGIPGQLHGQSLARNDDIHVRVPESCESFHIRRIYPLVTVPVYILVVCPIWQNVGSYICRVGKRVIYRVLEQGIRVRVTRIEIVGVGKDSKFQGVFRRILPARRRSGGQRARGRGSLLIESLFSWLFYFLVRLVCPEGLTMLCCWFPAGLNILPE